MLNSIISLVEKNGFILNYEYNNKYNYERIKGKYRDNFTIYDDLVHWYRYDLYSHSFCDNTHYSHVIFIDKFNIVFKKELRLLKLKKIIKNVK